MPELKTAPIDTFETLSRAPASDTTRMALGTTALAHGIPILELNPSARDELKSLTLLDDPALNVALDEGFASYCLYAAARWKDQKSLSRQIVDRMIRSKPENSHPLLRLMRNHWFWLWYESLLTARAIRKPSEGQQIRYWQEAPLLIGGQIVRCDDGVPNLLLGPVLVADETGDGDVEMALARFEKAIEDGWSSVKEIHRPKTLQERSGGKFQLYTSALLARLTGARTRLTWDDLQAIGVKVLPHLSELKKVSGREFSLGPYRSIFHLGATITGFEKRAGSVAHEHHLVLDTVVHHPKADLQRRPVDVELFYRGDRKPQPEIDRIARAQGAKISSSWRSYIRDCNAILAAWLSRSLWERVASTNTNADWGTLGERLTKFLANAFLANECNVYQVDYAKALPCLAKIGGFSDDNDGDAKSEMMRFFMQDLDSDERKHSICYAAMEQNVLQYVEFEDPSTRPEDRRLAFPTDSKWEMRGRSAVALPIRVNGMIWGVLELVSFNFDHFPFNVRVQLGEVVDTFGNALSFQAMSEMLNNIDQIVADTDLDIQAKRDRIVASLPRYFMSTDVALLRFRSGPDRAVEYSLAAHIGHHPAFLPGENLGHLFDNTIKHMISRNAPVAAGTFLQELAFKSVSDEFDTVIALLPSTGGDVPAGAVVMRLALPIRPEAAWHQPLQVLGRYFLNAIDTLDTEIYWVRHQRSRYGHELIRNINAIDDVELRLKNLIVAELKHAAGRQDLGRLLDDLDRAKRSLKLYAEALTDATLTSNRFDDLRVAAMKRHLSLTAAHAKRPIDVRETFHAAIYSRRAEARDAKIKFLPFPLFEYPRVRIDDVLLYDVVSTLVDNAIKYAIPNSSVGLTPRVHDAFQVAVSNLGAELRDDEKHLIFQDRFRGRYAEMHLPESGLGLGLGYARALMELAGGDVTHAQRRPKTPIAVANFDANWHDFVITFPKRVFRNAE
jgi:signal transduction histidine kinase